MKKTLIIAEAGVNHNGEIKKAILESKKALKSNGIIQSGII